MPDIQCITNIDNIGMVWKTPLLLQNETSDIQIVWFLTEFGTCTCNFPKRSQIDHGTTLLNTVIIYHDWVKCCIVDELSMIASLTPQHALYVFHWLPYPMSPGMPSIEIEIGTFPLAFSQTPSDSAVWQQVGFDLGITANALTKPFSECVNNTIYSSTTDCHNHTKFYTDCESGSTKHTIEKNLCMPK